MITINIRTNYGMNTLIVHNIGIESNFKLFEANILGHIRSI